MMKSISYILILSFFLFVQCSPKNADIVLAPSGQSPEVMMDKVDIHEFRKRPPAPTAAPIIQLGEAATFTLDNGLKVIVVENHKLPRVAYRIFVDYDPILEGDKAGLVQLATAQLDKGTTTKTKSEIDETIDFVGASLSASSTGVEGSCLTKHSDVLLGVMSDVLLHPSFPESEFEKSKKQTISGLKAYTTDPNSMSSAVGSAIAFGINHPYGEMQSEETVNNVNIDDLKNFYQSRYKPNISYLVVVGDVNVDEARIQAEKYFGHWKRGVVESLKYDSPNLPIGNKVSFVDKTHAVQSVINVTYPVDLKRNSEDLIKSSVMTTLFGGFFGSRLNENLREDKAYTYGVRANLRPDEVAGSFGITASVRNEVTDSSLTEVLKELNKIVTEPVSQSELDMTKSVMSGRFARSLENPQVIARFALNTARFDLPKNYYANYLSNLDAVSVSDVHDMAGKYLKPENANIVVVGNQDEVAEKLGTFSHDGQVDYYTPFAKIKKVSSKPLDVTATDVISQYLNSLGGKDKLIAVNDVKMTAKAEVMGQTLTIEDYWQKPNKSAKLVSMAGQVINSQVFDGTSAMVTAMGQVQSLSDEKVKDLAFEGRFVPELFYKKMGTEIELKGLEDLGGKQVYKMVITKPSGSKFTEFFDKDSGFKVKRVGEEEGKTVNVEYGSYNEFDGIMAPSIITVSGIMPVPLSLEVSELIINGGLEDGLFKVGP